MREVGVTEAKKRWSELLWLAASGEEIAITNRGRVLARLERDHFKREHIRH
jgi:prevent-host-death family protein